MAKKPLLNPEQEKAVTHGDGPLLIIAGAGTGKTTVITERIRHLLLEKNVLPSDILALTFTEKAAREMEERVDIALPYGYTQLWISTFHAFCDRILKDEAISIGLNPGFTIASEAESILFLRKNLYKFELDYFRPLGNPFKFVQGMLQHFSRLKDDDITPEQYLHYAERLKKRLEKKAKTKVTDKEHDEAKRIQELSQAFSLYEKLKAEEGTMDFSDLNANVLRLFRTRKNILSHYQNKFKYILVDEFQDTNFAQNELAILLAGKRKNITVVGDDDQAIYRWRGAALANIIQFKDHFPKAKIIALTKNYRSTRSILDTSYKLIQNNNPDRLEVKEKINKQLISMRDIEGADVTLLFGQRAEQEADLVVEKIDDLIEKSDSGKTSTGRKLQYKDFAILIRANDHAVPFTRSLEGAGIPYQFLGPGHLFHQEEIKYLIAYLKVLANFEDSATMYRVLTQRVYGFDARDVAAVLNFAKKKNYSLFEALEQVDDTFLPEMTKHQIRELVAMIKRHLTRVPRDTAGQILYYYVEDSGLMKEFLNPKNALEEKKVQNIARFFEKLKSYEAENKDASVFAVTDWIDLSLELGESPLAADVDWTENNAVNILTIHSSKGLEFPVVFITNLVTQRFPTRDRKEQIPIPEDIIRETLPEGDQNIAEERRLFYVAMTRARDHLFLTAAHYYGEGKRERKISPFVYETLGEQFVNEIIQKEKAEKSSKQLSLLDVLQPISARSDDTEGILQLPPSKLFPVNFISFSQIHTFDTCPLHYKLKYILRIPPFPSAALSFGSSVHAALRDYFQHHLSKEKIKKLINVDELLQRNWISEGYGSKSHEKTSFDHAKKIINAHVKENEVTPLAVEIPFQFSLGNLKVGGRIDRVDRLSDSAIEIIDYKTGQNIHDEKKMANDIQLTLYALAATKVNDTIFNKKPEDITLSLFYLGTNKKLTTKRTKEQLDALETLLVTKAEEISKSNFACNVKNCKNCEYSLLCKTFAG